MNILVTGASGVLGAPLYTRCHELGFNVLSAGRVPQSPNWLTWNMEMVPPYLEQRIHCVFHTAPLWLLPDNIGHLARWGTKRIISFSSTSVFTKSESPDVSERKLALALSDSESRVHSESNRYGVNTTIFRPTMVYGYGRDKNIAAIARFIRKYGFFAVAGDASGKRQPVHVDDLVAATLSNIEKKETFGKIYTLAGQEILTYYEMIERIFEGLQLPSRIIKLPFSLYKTVLVFASLISPHVTGAMAGRMNEDLTFEYREAQKDFGFSPAKFLEHPERDLSAA